MKSTSIFGSNEYGRAYEYYAYGRLQKQKNKK